MLRAGFSRFVVDPGVRQAYFPDTARQLYTKKASPPADFCVSVTQTRAEELLCFRPCLLVITLVAISKCNDEWVKERYT